MSFGARIREYRKESGLSQQEMAVLLDMSTGTIGNWEKGRFLPVDDAFPSIARKMGVSEAWLRDGTGPMRGGEIPPTYLRHDESPTEKTSNPLRAGEGAMGYSVHTRTITLNEDTDVVYEPVWVVKILLSAAAAVLAKEDVERARRARRSGKPFRFRLVYEEETDPREHEEPPPPKG